MRDYSECPRCGSSRILLLTSFVCDTCDPPKRSREKANAAQEMLAPVARAQPLQLLSDYLHSRFHGQYSPRVYERHELLLCQNLFTSGYQFRTASDKTPDLTMLFDVKRGVEVNGPMQTRIVTPLTMPLVGDILLTDAEFEGFKSLGFLISPSESKALTGSGSYYRLLTFDF